MNGIDRFSRLERAGAVTLALSRTGVCAWRAATQSLVHDEAFTYNNFVSGSWRHVYLSYHSNNHVLLSLLSKASVTLFGLSEFALRLPSVIAGLFLMLGLWLVLESSDSAAVRWSAFIAVGLHPLMLDFSVAARGYGLAIALLAWAVYAAMQGRNALAGLLLGLAISANLSMGFAALGLLAAVVCTDDSPPGSRLRGLVTVGLPAASIAAAICWGALRTANLGMFYVGLPAIRVSLFNLIYTSIRATPKAGLFGTSAAARVFEFGIFPLVLVLIASQAYSIWRSAPKERKELIPAATLAAAGLGMLLAHRLFGLNYPVDRLGLPFELLSAMAWALAAGRIRRPWLIAANVTLGCALALQFATQFEVGYFQTWWYDASTKKVAQRLMEESRGNPPVSISVGATWIHQPALEFYRNYYHIAALKPIERREPTLLSGQDYYVLNNPDTESSAARAFMVLFSDPFSGIVLARGDAR